jgi:ADP-ribose pyrophosphatase
METWKTLSRSTLLDTGRFLKVENHVVQLPDGRIIENWPWVIIPDYVNVVAVVVAVVAVKPNQDFICFRQVKYAVEGTSHAVVGGIIDPGETPLEAAKRELKEESGYVSDQWIFLGEYSADANRGAGKCSLFLALDAQKVCDPHSDDLEEQELVCLSLDEIRAALRAGEFKVLSWTAAVALALVFWSKYERVGK